MEEGRTRSKKYHKRKSLNQWTEKEIEIHGKLHHG